jgi:hypothetical protein
MMISPVRVVRLANYVAPASGGLRTALRELGAGYLAAGHEPVLVIPGPRPGRRLTEQGLVITVPGPAVPGTGGTGRSPRGVHCGGCWISWNRTGWRPQTGPRCAGPATGPAPVASGR